MNKLYRKPTAWLPPLLSAAALAVVITHLVTGGTSPEADEGAAAHLFQLLIALQVPIILLFAYQSVPKEPRPALIALGLHTGAIMAALALVAIFNL